MSRPHEQALFIGTVRMRTRPDTADYHQNVKRTQCFVGQDRDEDIVSETLQKISPQSGEFPTCKIRIKMRVNTFNE